MAKKIAAAVATPAIPNIDSLDLDQLNNLMHQVQQRQHALAEQDRLAKVAASKEERSKVCEKLRTSQERAKFLEAQKNWKTFIKKRERLKFTVVLTVDIEDNNDPPDDIELKMDGAVTGVTSRAQEFLDQAVYDFTTDACEDSLEAFFPNTAAALYDLRIAYDDYKQLAARLFPGEYLQTIEDVERFLRRQK